MQRFVRRDGSPGCRAELPGSPTHRRRRSQRGQFGYQVESLGSPTVADGAAGRKAVSASEPDEKTSAFLLRRPRAGGFPSVSRISTGVSSLSNRGTLAFACKLYVTAPVPFTQRAASARCVEAGCVLECEARTPQCAGQRSTSSKPGYFPGCPGFFFAKSRFAVVIPSSPAKGR